MKRRKVAPFLSRDTLLCVASKLDGRSLVRFAGTCRFLRDLIVSSSFLWENVEFVDGLCIPHSAALDEETAMGKALARARLGVKLRNVVLADETPFVDVKLKAKG